MAKRLIRTSGRPGSPRWWPGPLLNRAVAESGAPPELQRFYFLFANEVYLSATRGPASAYDELATQVLLKWRNRGLPEPPMRIIVASIRRALIPRRYKA
jgi:hypothetical protein